MNSTLPMKVLPMNKPQCPYHPYNLEEKSKWELIQMIQELTQNNFK